MSEERAECKTDCMFVSIEQNPTSIAEIKALMEKCRGIALPPEVAWDPVTREEALVRALDRALKIIERFEERHPTEYIKDAHSTWKGSEIVRAIARGEKIP